MHGPHVTGVESHASCCFLPRVTRPFRSTDVCDAECLGPSTDGAKASWCPHGFTQAGGAQVHSPKSKSWLPGRQQQWQQGAVGRALCGTPGPCAGTQAAEHVPGLANRIMRARIARAARSASLRQWRGGAPQGPVRAAVLAPLPGRAGACRGGPASCRVGSLP